MSLRYTGHSMPDLITLKPSLSVIHKTILHLLVWQCGNSTAIISMSSSCSVIIFQVLGLNRHNVILRNIKQVQTCANNIFHVLYASFKCRKTVGSGGDPVCAPPYFVSSCEYSNQKNRIDKPKIQRFPGVFVFVDSLSNRLVLSCY